MKSSLIGIVFATFATLTTTMAFAQAPPDEQRRRPGPPTITVTGQGQSASRPDRAVVRLGAVAQAEQASSAQQEVNQIMERAIEAIQELGVPEASISTAGISLFPVYPDQPPRPMGNDRPREPRIVGYRASNTVRVQLDDLSRVGPVIDAGVGAGANNVEGLNFELKEDTAARSEALRDAARQARAKADAIAEAMDLRIENVVDIVEGGVNIMRPQMEFARAGMAAMDVATPVQPGQVQVDATVVVTFRVSPADEARPGR